MDTIGDLYRTFYNMNFQELLYHHLIAAVIWFYHGIALGHDVVLAYALGIMGSLTYYLYKNLSVEKKSKLEVKLVFIILLLIIIFV